MQSILRKLKNIHFLSLMGNGSMAVINMVIMAVLYRSLPIADNGTWIFYQTAVLFVDTFRTGFLNTAFVKFYSGTTKERSEEVIGSAWYLTSIITGTFILLNLPALLLVPYFENVGLLLFIKYLSINLLVTVPNIVALCIAQGALRFDRVLYIRLFNNGLVLIFIVILALLKKATLESIVYANLTAIGIANLISLFAGWSGVEFFNKKSFSCVKELFHFGKFSVGTSISSSLFKVTDTFMINFLLGPAALSIYNLGQRLMEIVEIPLRSFTVTAMPQMSAAYNQGKKEEVIHIMKKYVGIITVGLIPVFIVAFLLADVAIGLIGGGKYIGTEASNVFRLFMTFALFFPVDRFLAVGIDVIHKPQLNFIKVLVMLVINFVFDYLGISLFGNVYGITIATLFPTLFAVIMGCYVMKKYYIPYQIWSAYEIGFSELKGIFNNYLVKFKLRAANS